MTPDILISKSTLPVSKVVGDHTIHATAYGYTIIHHGAKESKVIKERKDNKQSCTMTWMQCAELYLEGLNPCPPAP